MTFKEIQDDALDRLLYDSNLTSSGPRTRIKRNINQWQRKICSAPENSKLRKGTASFTTAQGTVLYGLPFGIEKIAAIYDAATNNPRLSKKSGDWLRWDTRANLNQGTPWAYIDHGVHPIYYVPASTGIWAVSSAAGDTTQTVSMNAIRTGGYPHQAGPTTLTGTSRVQIGSRTDYIDITKLMLSAVAVGDISFYDASSSGNLLAVIPIGQLTARYYVLQPWPVPSSAITYTIDCWVNIFDMSLDYDTPMMPQDFHDLLGDCARYEEMRDVKKMVREAKVMWDDEIVPRMRELTDWLLNNPDYIVVPDDGRRSIARIGSNLGSWFPPGRW